MGRPRSARSRRFCRERWRRSPWSPSPTELGWRSLEVAEFVEDTVKVTPRLELRAGFRSESTDGWNEAQGRAANYAIVNGVLQTAPVVGNSALSD